MSSRVEECLGRARSGELGWVVSDHDKTYTGSSQVHGIHEYRQYNNRSIYHCNKGVGEVDDAALKLDDCPDPFRACFLVDMENNKLYNNENE